MYLIFLTLIIIAIPLLIRLSVSKTNIKKDIFNYGMKKSLIATAIKILSAISLIIFICIKPDVLKTPYYVFNIAVIQFSFNCLADNVTIYLDYKNKLKPDFNSLISYAAGFAIVSSIGFSAISLIDIVFSNYINSTSTITISNIKDLLFLSNSFNIIFHLIYLSKIKNLTRFKTLLSFMFFNAVFTVGLVFNNEFYSILFNVLLIIVLSFTSEKLLFKYYKDNLNKYIKYLFVIIAVASVILKSL